MYTPIVVYADDIFLIAPWMHDLQLMLSICKRELISTDMFLHVNKSLCMRFGPRCNVNAVRLVTGDGRALQWVGFFMYLGIYLLAYRDFKCNWTIASLVSIVHFMLSMGEFAIQHLVKL